MTTMPAATQMRRSLNVSGERAVPMIITIGYLLLVAQLFIQHTRLFDVTLSGFRIPAVIFACFFVALLASGGLIAACGVIGPIIPPSIGFVIFGVAGGVSITKLFLAGIFPGILLAAGLWATWWWLTRKEDLQPPPRSSNGEVWAAFRSAGWALTLPMIILVGLRMGVFTPTEAAWLPPSLLCLWLALSTKS